MAVEGGTEYPAFHAESDVPAEYSFAEILRVTPLVYWDGATANASSVMDYYGNHAKQTLTLSISKGDIPVATTTGSSTDEHVVPWDYRMLTSGVTYQVAGTCGYLANLASTHEAAVIVLIEFHGVTDWSHVSKPGSDGKSQPECRSAPCSSVSSNDQTAAGGYDPYSFASYSGGDCTGGGSGSGIQYQPGDYTGGETVDWTTGVGNGGASACGQAAQVEFLCIEYMTAAGEWRDLGCGYVTTC